MGSSEPAVDQQKKSKETLEAACEFLFSQYDQDRDGFLDQYEFCLFLWDLRATSARSLRKGQIVECWRVADKNQTGTLSVADFREAMDVLWENDFFEDDNELDDSISTDSFLLSLHSGSVDTLDRIKTMLDEEDETLRKQLKAEYLKNEKLIQEMEFRIAELQKSSSTLPTISISSETSSPVFRRRAISLQDKDYQQSQKRAWEEAQRQFRASELSLGQKNGLQRASTENLLQFNKAADEVVVSLVEKVDILVRVFKEGEADSFYKTFMINRYLTAESFLPMVLEKFQLPSEDVAALALIEQTASGESKVIPGNALISTVNLETSKIYLRPKNFNQMPKKRKSGLFKPGGF